MQYLQRNLSGVRTLNERFGHCGQRDAHAARCRAGDAGQRADGNGRVHKRVRNAAQRVADHEEAWQRGNHATESVL
ncbi:hypothetical protein D3C72_2103560 [compost metagenome]